MVLEQQTTDEYGYTGYAVVVLMPQMVREEVARARDQLSIPIHMIPAHVTVKGTFVQLQSLDEITRIIGSVVQEYSPFSIGLEEPLIWSGVGSRTLVISVKSSVELDSLHHRLFNSIEPITTNAYGTESAVGFHFHMTVYQEVDDVNHQKGQTLAADLSLPESVDARSVCLRGRVGPRGRGGKWQVIEEYPFSGT